MTRVVCPGSYDPPTNGHLDVFERASRLFEEVVVLVGVNKSKKGLFTVEERIELLASAVGHLGNVRVDSWYGLTVDYCAEHGVQAIVKGLRTATDFDYELPMAQMNQQLTGVETLFVPTRPGYSHLSSSLVKEVAAFGGEVVDMLPPEVHKRLLVRLAEQRDKG
ncbi:Phosphopantetheine adenylyltransferase [Actinokineospora spheciospongiae]|uniref:Phosphopantetheine adenylyltransferase n=1 Tax=Actinokineospora spheciospongiae TaxID=909613 RepID=W7J4A4_9PSEU|nr:MULTISPECIES: pantetheine-phosphate adenylyltransferase [Actinokineospora]EWC60969.1 Phosphopantetheine adenylyltransferase [Actinokineospora spheciospongiae]MCG8917525.1 pantetheine-phosphate adenylyltransferase [Actinokineospora sp. PR83]